MAAQDPDRINLCAMLDASLESHPLLQSASLGGLQSDQGRSLGKFCPPMSAGKDWPYFFPASRIS
jgi:hypothetical protein